MQKKQADTQLPNVHKDFHGCLSFGLKWLAENCGPNEVNEYLRQVARTVYVPLVEAMKRHGLVALRDHKQRIMALEEADFQLHLDEGVLIVEVLDCPAIHHMREHGYEVAPNFCESSWIVNDEICRQAGYACSIEYDQAEGRCVQRFWRHE